MAASLVSPLGGWHVPCDAEMGGGGRRSDIWIGSGKVVACDPGGSQGDSMYVRWWSALRGRWAGTGLGVRVQALQAWTIGLMSEALSARWETGSGRRLLSSKRGWAGQQGSRNER